MMARESPTFAIYTVSPIIMTKQAHEPDLSLMTISFFFMNSSSASLKAFFSAISGVSLRHSYFRMSLGIYSRRYSAHP